MEENKTTVEDVKVEETGKVDTQTTEKNEEKAEQTFTQDQVNSMIKKEKQKIENKYKDIDIAKYKEWEESQKTAEQKQAEKEAENKAKDIKLTQIMRENLVLKSGVKEADDVDYIMYKVSKMEGEFEENLAKFLKDNPKYLKGQELEEQKATGAPVKTISSTESGVASILKSKHPELFE